MQSLIKCPDCGSYNIEEISHKATDRAEESPEEHPEEAEHIKYECLDCGLQFYESNLRE